MRKFVVEYRYQAVHMPDESCGVCVVDAESEAEAVGKAERQSEAEWRGAYEVTPCEENEREFSVDLCDGDAVVASFSVWGYFPISEKAGGEPYLQMIGTARSKAIEVAKEKYPDFYRKLQSLHGCPDGFYHLTYADTMVIVRPASWVKSGTRAYEVRIDYENSDGRKRFYKTVRAVDCDGAVRVASASAQQEYECKVIAAKAVRIAELPSMQE